MVSKSFSFSLIIILFFSSIALSQFQNVRISSVSSTTPEEVSIAINPANPLNLAAGANISFYYYSTDGGYSWKQGNLTSTYGVWGDPSVVYDANGNLYFGHLSYPPSPGYWIDRIVVQKSTNGGQTWNSGTGIFVNPPKEQDKEWLAVDMTNSPYRDYLYATWTEFDSYGSSSKFDSTRILFSRSTNSGDTWSAPVRISDKGGNCVDEDNTVEGAVPAIGPNGEIYTSWSGPLGIMFDKSTNGGVNWGNDVFVTSQPGGWDFAVSGIYRANGMPVTACDVSNSPYRGTIYIQWSDQRNGATNTDIFIIKSTDGGSTWGNVTKVNDDNTTRHQFFSWMTIDQITGYLYVGFYDRRETTGDATDFYVAKSTDGGETFTNFKVSSSSFVPSSDVFFGDYTNIAAYNGKIYPIWMRLDNGNLSVWTALVRDSIKTSVTVAQKWNMISVPVLPDDFRKSALFPTAVSGAFEYNNEYTVKETLALGSGYWLKFSESQTLQISGRQLYVDTISLKPGWNLIGSISYPVPVNEAMLVPSAPVTPIFYGYNSGYVVEDTLVPGKAYWLYTSVESELILTGIHSTVRGLVGAEITKPEPVYASSPNTISYELKERSLVTLKLSEREGEREVMLVNEEKNPGNYQLTVDPYQFEGRMYYYWLYVRPVGKESTAHEVKTGKITIR